MKPWEMDWGSKTAPEASGDVPPWERDWGSGDKPRGAHNRVQALLGLSYPQMLGHLESGGRDEAKAPSSSALGRYQFTKDTWLKMVLKAAPAWARGLDRDEILALRTDPEKAAEMESYLREENATILSAKDVEVNNVNLYAAHHFGPDKAVKFAQAKDDAPMATILTPAQLEANPYLRKLTKGQTIDNWANRVSGKPWLQNWENQGVGMGDD